MAGESTGGRRRRRFSLASIRVRIFAAFLVMGALTTALGAYAYYSISLAGRIVVDIYDRPLMAINFARSASLAFMQMNASVLHQRLAPPTAREAYRAEYRQWAQTFDDDIAIARERALSERSLQIVGEIEGLVREWKTLVGQDDALANESRRTEINELADRIVQRFDLLIELTAGQSFVERQRAVQAIDRFEYLGLAATVLAFLLAAIITFMLGRQIIRPLESAAESADRIAGGELETKIPAGGRDETGALLRSMQIMQDNIRDMMEREQAQRESAQMRLGDALASASEAMLLADRGGRVIATSPQIATYFPSVFPLMTPGALFRDLFPKVGFRLSRGGNGQASVIEPEDVADALCEGGEFQLASGTWLRVNRSRTSEDGFFLFFSDISEIKAREESLRIAKQEAEAANAAKSNFLANMSHELRTPLNAIIGFSEMMNGELFGRLGDKRYRDYAKDILASGQHLLEIINSVLDLAKSESGRMQIDVQEYSLDSVVEHCRRTLKPLCEESQLSFEVENDAAGLVMNGDPAKMRQILLNLLSNAVKFTEPRGRVRLSIVSPRPDRLEVVVADTGIGMRPEDVSIALSPFGQVDSSLARRYEGTGLGLPLTKALVELHGGTILVDTAPGAGTTVTVTMPRQATASGEGGLFAPRRAASA